MVPDRDPENVASGAAFEGTIDWDRYWREWRRDGEEPQDYTASVSHHHVDLLDRFFERVGVPADAAFVGCGPGELAAAVATEHPPMDVLGYDAARSVIASNREAYAEVPNLSFEVATLPDFDVDRRFDLVFCYATLHYVREIETAIENLYRRVEPDGHLVCHYPNEGFRDDHRDAAGDLRDRLALVCEGENVVSAARIEGLLGAEVRDFWAFVDADTPAARPENPCAFVRRE